MASSKKPLRADLQELLHAFLNTTVRPGQQLRLGLSGGLDSCVLLHVLAALRGQHGFQLEALHVNHGLSAQADAWARFCAETCAALDVPFQSVSVQVPRDSGLGLEAAARVARYRVLTQPPVDAVMLAHHRDDQAETLLLQLLRGAGVKGMAAMPAASAMPGGVRLLRPFLDVPRATLLAYAQSRGLRWMEDESNLDLAYDRNFLRHAVFPALEQRFPAARTTLARAAAHLAETAALLDEMARQDAGDSLGGDTLQVEVLRRLNPPRARNLLRYWLQVLGLPPPSARRLRELHRQLTAARADARLAVDVAGGTVHRYRDRAWFAPAVASAAPGAVVWHGEPVLSWPGGRLEFVPGVGEGVSMVAVERAGLRVQLRTGGEMFRPHAGRPTRPLRKWLQEAGVPPWQRVSLPLLYVGETLAVVPGVGMAPELQAAPGEPGLRVSWCADGA